MKKVKILIVDDERDLVDLVQLRLESEGFTVICAEDGQAGLEKVKDEKPDLILLDVMMPKMNGYQVCRLLKFDLNFKKIPIIMLTARGQENDKKTGHDVGVDDYVTKPFEMDDLVRRVNSNLAQKKTIDAA